MRHIPEEELHAYLDQALSRAQAVEIESHLAGCARCQAERDAIAGLRDRTTALLAVLAPAPSHPRPAWSELRRRHQQATAQRARLLRAGVWAASLIGALGLGYVAHAWRDAAELPAVADRPAAPALDAPVSIPLPVTTAAVRRAPATRGAAPRQLQGLEFDSLDAATRPGAGVWRTESYVNAVAAGLTVPRVAGLPVLQIQIQEASSPLVAVDQQLNSGDVVRTISGPVTELAALDSSAVASAGPAGSGPSSVSLRYGNRMFLMTGRIPTDSLRALLTRVKTH